MARTASAATDTPKRTRRTTARKKESPDSTFGAPPGTRLVLSTFKNHLLCLEAPEVVGLGTPQQAHRGGVTIRFEDFKAFVPEEHLEKLEACADFVGHKIAYPNDPMFLHHGASPLETIRGTMVTTKHAPKAPIAGWDDMPDDELREILEEGRLTTRQVMDCLTWETSHRRRPWLIIGLSEFIEEDDPEEPAEPEAPPAEEIDPTEMPLNIAVPGSPTPPSAMGGSGTESDGGFFS